MTAAISAGFLSRAEVGLAPPRSISRNVRPQDGGVAYHHGGDNVPILRHADCLATWRSWQRFHQETRGWADLAYSLGVCPHGYVLAGRGYGIRTAANGTNDGNDRFLAICGIVGARQTVSGPMLEAFAWATAELRRLGAGNRVVGHQDLKATSCPHPALLKLARELDRTPIRAGASPAAPTEEDVVMATLDELRTVIREEAGHLAGAVWSRPVVKGGLRADLALNRAGTHAPIASKAVAALLERTGTTVEVDAAEVAAAVVDGMGAELAAQVVEEISRRLAT